MIVQFWKRYAFSVAVELFVFFLLSHMRNLPLALDNQDTLAPKSFPMIAVAAIANAPQQETLQPSRAGRLQDRQHPPAESRRAQNLQRQLQL